MNSGLAYFPTLYKDELLYSGIARYHRTSGNRTQKQTIFDLFGERLVCATTDLPSHIGEMINRISYEYSCNQIINNHTMFPYFSSFMNEARKEDVKQLMEKGASEGVVHAKLGLLASKVKSPAYLRFCLKCYEEELLDSEPYWHRTHQLPGVVFCDVHNEMLYESNITLTTQEHKFKFTSLVQVNIKDAKIIEVKSNWIETLQLIAKYSIGLLSPSKLEKPSYKNSLESLGCITFNGRYRFDRLIREVKGYFGEDLLQFLNCDIPLKSSDTWLHKIIRGSEVSHPLRHVLLQCLFSFHKEIPISKLEIPFGNGPWPCLNKVADHYKKTVIEKCVITLCSKTKLPVGTFICCCGFEYSRRGPDKNESDRLKIGRIKSFGSIWREKLNELQSSNLSLRAKAAILGVDPGTVKNQSVRLVDSVRIKTYKKKSKIVCEKKNKQVENRVNWNQRDKTLIKEIQRVIPLIKSIDKPIRLTMASLARAITDKKLKLTLRNSLDKLPNTKKYIKKCVETKEQFQIRRLLWAAEQLKNSEYKIAGWRLMRYAGLNQPLKGEVRKNYLRIINEEGVT